MSLKDIGKRLGPGFITGTSDDDPAGIGTYVQAGAQFGSMQAWTALFTIPIMTIVQEMCARIGLVTGRGIGTLIRTQYARPLLWFIVVLQIVTNTITIGADLSAMAESAQLLVPIGYWWLLGGSTVAMVALITFVPYARYASYLKVLGLTLFAYVAAAFVVHANWPQVLHDTIVPVILPDKAYVLTLIAVLGVTISPYEFFWQANEEVEELIEEGKLREPAEKRPKISLRDVTFMRWDTAFGMFVSNLITYFVIVTAAATLHASHHTNVQSAKEAAEVLRPLAGPFASALFTLGIVSSGLLAIPVMAASSGYLLCGAVDWPRSLTRTLRECPQFYAIIGGSCFMGLLVNAFGVSPFRLLYISAILSGAISPVMLFIVTHLASNHRLMGRYANPWWSTLVGYALAAFMVVVLALFFLLSRAAS